MDAREREEIKRAIETMRSGGIILYPTDTIWGIGCDATNAEAVARVYRIKQREESKALIVLTDNANAIPRYVREMPDIAWDLIDVSDKPLTIIYDGARNLAENLIADDGSVAIRVTKEEFSNALCCAMKVPVVSTSANISGKPSAARFSEISEEIKNAVDYIVNYRRDENKAISPSSIIKLGKSGEVKVIR